MSSKGKAVAAAGISEAVPTAPLVTRYRCFVGLREWYVCVFKGLIGPIVRACSTPNVLSLSSRQGGVSRSERDKGGRRVLVTALGCWSSACAPCVARRAAGRKAMPRSIAISEFCSARERGAAAILAGIRDFGVIVSWEAHVERVKRRGYRMFFARWRQANPSRLTNKVVLATYQLRGFAQQWWRLKMQTTFADRSEEVVTWPEFLENCSEFCSARERGAAAILAGIRDFGVIVPWAAHVERVKRRGSVVSRVLREVATGQPVAFRFRIGVEYDIILDAEEDSYLLRKSDCIAMSLDLMEAGFRLPIPAVVRKIKPTADLFRAHFSLAASPMTGPGVFYIKHRANRMCIDFSPKYSNNKGWTRYDSFLIRDAAKISERLSNIYVPKAEEYLTKAQLVKHGLSRAWSVEELAGDHDMEEMGLYAEQISVTSHIEVVGEGPPKTVPTPSRPASGQPAEKRPMQISLREEPSPRAAKKAKKAAKRAAEQTAKEEAEVAAPQPQTQKKKRKLVKAASKAVQQAAEEEEAEEEEAPHLEARKKRKAAKAVEQRGSQIAPEVPPVTTGGVATELGLVVVSDESEGSFEERVGTSTPQDPFEGRTEEVAVARASSTAAAEQIVAEGEAVATQGSTSRGADEERILLPGKLTLPRRITPAPKKIASP
ncbi:hypothetical protein Taro_014084 [Colocasia esculenta]|uniref:Uncharacterized protein n=1 Tax=Colocasia esculenta TaxID=4460 RepID=A0A843UKS9_COLES|nr:hypothetical protein [Colocasia esculenta]